MQEIQLIREMRTIGIFGGSFDPIHDGHLAVARGALRECGLDEVWLMVSPENPLKRGALHAPESARLEMVRLAVDSLADDEKERIKVSDFEFSLPRPSYTVDTLKRLSQIYPDVRFVWIGGGDNLANLRRWKSPEVILKDFGLIVYPRPDSAIPDPLPQGVSLLKGVEEFPYSSTQVRRMIAQVRKNALALTMNLPVPAAVIRYIGSHPDLYAD